MGLFDQFKSLLDGKLNIDQRYELLREAVSGTMSSFYMARDRKTGEVVGLKVLDPSKTEFFESRFRGLSKPSEGEIAMKLNHPRIVKTLGYGVTNRGENYLLMEYLDGPGLNTLIKDRSPLLVENRLALIRQMAEALGAVHKAGYIHRDICPRNFICNAAATELKLIDFGLTVPATKEFMQPGNRTGTPNYMAPEVVRRRPTDRRLDIFSLGVTYFQLTTFELPWPSQDVTGKAAMLHDTKEPVDIRSVRPVLHPRLASLIMDCLAKQPADRPQSTEEILRALSNLKSDSAD
jgi:eukaryotic-like serine/threonine-protein kinase